MGPQLFSRGDLLQMRPEGSVTIASMGPQLFSRGDASVIGEKVTYLQLQWGHSFSAVEMGWETVKT